MRGECWEGGLRKERYLEGLVRTRDADIGALC